MPSSKYLYFVSILMQYIFRVLLQSTNVFCFKYFICRHNKSFFRYKRDCHQGIPLHSQCCRSTPECRYLHQLCILQKCLLFIYAGILSHPPPPPPILPTPILLPPPFPPFSLSFSLIFRSTSQFFFRLTHCSAKLDQHNIFLILIYSL